MCSMRCVLLSLTFVSNLFAMNSEFKYDFGPFILRSHSAGNESQHLIVTGTCEEDKGISIEDIIVLTEHLISQRPQTPLKAPFNILRLIGESSLKGELTVMTMMDYFDNLGL